MIQKVMVEDEELDAIVLECDIVTTEEYRHSLLEVLKCAVINTKHLNQAHVWNVLAIVQSMEKKGGQA